MLLLHNGVRQRRKSVRYKCKSLWFVQKVTGQKAQIRLVRFHAFGLKNTIF